MSLIFYDCPTAPSPRRARILLSEKNVPHETVNVDLTTREQLGDAYRAINPSCTVPALKLEDGTVLTENSGIAAYLEAQYPKPAMLGVSAAEKGLVATWNTKAEMEGLWAVAEALRNSTPHMKGRALTGSTDFEQIPALAERGMTRLKLFFEMLEARLEGRDFLAIDNFSIADITAVVAIDFSRIVKMKPDEKFPNIVRWRDAMHQRPSMAT